MLFVLFGLPGAGKTHVGKLLQEHFGFYLYDGDLAMPKALLRALRNHEEISDYLRDEFFSQLIDNVKRYKKKYPHLVVAQTFIKEKYREQFLHSFPNAVFIFITANRLVREKRLMNRKKPALLLSYWQKMARIFEPPTIKHFAIVNNTEGDHEVIAQVKKILMHQKGR